ncbi:MAG: Crossover junction endodeoxyribonuclease RuvC [Parcubacteria group bacterium GW2011_GWA1_38_7]|nr:MAG: Crossover junction endodeoxyribonuclease RuvC [Parcubacteria group bacterium GW2011_GWA1_38_7]
MRSKKFLQMQNKNIILGIDPGYGRVGIAIIEKTNKCERLIHSECFETDVKLPHFKRLLLIGEKIKEIIKYYKPWCVAVETLLWSKNKKTALQVAEARGVILFEVARANIVLREFNPNQIKLAITGYGKSDKKQVINMVEKLVKIIPKKRHDDEYDAIATALTCAAISLSTDIP